MDTRGCADACQDQRVPPLMTSGPLGALLSTPRPGHLYHYTGPAGVVGILNSRTLWAGRPADMNDSTEQMLVHSYARNLLAGLRFPTRSFGEGMVQYARELLDEPEAFRFALSRAYTVSLSSERDSLEQWRAYAPRSGGVALGFSSEHLGNVAADQGFLLAPCAYDEASHREIVRQIVVHHLAVWQNRMPLDTHRQGISSHLVRDLIADLERFAPLLKHPSFSAEREWRLISPLVGEGAAAQFVHIPATDGIKQYRTFSLLTPTHPRIPDNPAGVGIVIGGPLGGQQGFRPIIGPSLNPLAMQEVVRTLTPPEFGRMWDVERTSSPYR